MASLFAPLNSSFLGFDRLFNDLDRLLADAPVAAAGFPPLNLYKDEDGYTIELAVAGFKKADIKIEHDKKHGILTVSGESGREEAEPEVYQESESRAMTSRPEPGRERTTIKRGIAKRKFTRSFTISDDLEIKGATLEDGMLVIDLIKVVREEDKPLLIAIR